MAANLLGFEQARAILLDGVVALPGERAPLAEAAGRVLAEGLFAAESLPPFDHSAMDGYALDTKGLQGAGPWLLEVAGESSAGKVAPALQRGAACRIFTGAAVPQGADAVVMQEHVAREGGAVRLTSQPKPGQNIRRRG